LNNRKSLADLIPDANLLVKLPAEQVAMQLLKVCASSRQNGTFPPALACGSQGLFEENFPFGGRTYPKTNQDEIELAAAEGFEWLRINGLVMPAPSPNQSSFRLTRKGEEIFQDERNFLSFLDARELPKSFIHPVIREEVWLQASLGQWATAVFVAFRAVEEAVRTAGGYGPNHIGVSLMREAFNKDTGPLANAEDPTAEREALSSLFAGAIGSYKNPHSHRKVAGLEATEAREMIMLASHLLRIVEDRVS
jgi:uncharacterized protein (TIGR02391 family)